MKGYLLSIFKAPRRQVEIEDLAVAIAPIVDSEHLKFVLHEESGVAMMYFESCVNKSEMYDFIYGVLYGVSNTFILTEINDDSTICFPSDIKQHLLNVRTGEGIGGELDMNIVLENTEFDEDDSFDDEDNDIMELLMKNRFKKSKPKPNLDSLLDKISVQGIESLTKFELKTLKEYSNN